MDQNQISILRDSFLNELEQEFQITQRVLSAAATGDKQYRPDSHAKTSFELAWHIASSDCWFANAICNGSFEGSDDSPAPSTVSTIADVATWYQKNFGSALEQLRSLSPEALSKPLNFMGIATLPAVMYMGWLRSHSIHHRGQLSTYLRPMGSKVPQIYGGSYDQPFGK